jgi:hypothetical protein
VHSNVHTWDEMTLIQSLPHQKGSLFEAVTCSGTSTASEHLSKLGSSSAANDGCAGHPGFPREDSFARALVRSCPTEPSSKQGKLQLTAESSRLHEAPLGSQRFQVQVHCSVAEASGRFEQLHTRSEVDLGTRNRLTNVLVFGSGVCSGWGQGRPGTTAKACTGCSSALLPHPGEVSWLP